MYFWHDDLLDGHRLVKQDSQHSGPKYSRDVPWSTVPQLKSRDFLDHITAEEMFEFLRARSLTDKTGNWKGEKNDQ